jgi:hypothetical protein
MEKLKLFFYCPYCNKRHSNYGLVPFEEKYENNLSLKVICGECTRKLDTESVNLSKSEITNFFFPNKIQPNEVILTFGRHIGMPITEIPYDYLEFILKEIATPYKERQYEFGLTDINRNVVESHLGKWWHPIEQKWIYIQ